MRKCGWAFNPILAHLPFSAAECWGLWRNCRILAAILCSTGWTQSLLEKVENLLRAFSLTETDFWMRSLSLLDGTEGGQCWLFYKTSLIWRTNLKRKMQKRFASLLKRSPKTFSHGRIGGAWTVSNIPIAYYTVTINTILPLNKPSGKKSPQNPNNLPYSKPALGI